jgi:hypothetical protein
MCGRTRLLVLALVLYLPGGTGITRKNINVG